MKRWLVAAAAAPMAFAASSALAQTTITDNTQAPVATSTTGDLTINSGAGVTVRTGGPAVTVDSNNNLSSNGTISVRGSPGGDGVLVTTGAGRTSNINIGGVIAADDIVADVDPDSDGVPDGPFVTPGTFRNGIHVTGTGVLTGTITTLAGTTISVKGDSGSSGILIEAPMIGNLNLAGGLGSLGDNSFALHTTAAITGTLNLTGPLQALGKNATAIAIDAPIDGEVRIEGGVITSGFRYTKTTDVPKGATLDAEDKLIGGPAIRITANVSHGFILDAPPPVTDLTDANMDGVPDNLDQDGDGVPDSTELTSSVEQFGSAPGLLVGGAAPVTLGNVATSGRDTLQLDRDAYGLIVRGVLTADGVYDGVSSVGVQVGGLGGTVDTSGGVSVTGQVVGKASNANTTGMIVGSGAIVPTINVGGGLISAGAQTVEGTVVDAHALQIDPGATVHVLNNSGTIKAGVNGPAGNAIAVLDQSGELTVINNTNTIQASVRTTDGTSVGVGDVTALDLTANTTGASVTQNANAVAAVVPQIIGDIKFSAGAGNDNLAVNAGITNGKVSFGGGADTLSVNNGATVMGGLTKAAGTLDVNIANGNLNLTELSAANATSLAVGSQSILTFTADPINADPTKRISSLSISGQTTFASGSQIKVNFLHKLAGDQNFTILTSGSLVNDGVIADLTNQLPALFTGDMTVGVNSVTIAARRRTTAELGLSGGRAQAYDAFYQAFDADPAIAGDILGKATASDFRKIYNQFLPDYSGGPFRTLAGTTREALQAQAEIPPTQQTDQPRSWLQEIGLTVKQETVDDVPYQTGGFGIVGGYERPMAGGGYLGFSGAFMSSEIRNEDRALGSHLSASAATGGVYWRQPVGDIVFDADATGGLAWFDSARKIVDQNSIGQQLLVREADAHWSGELLAGQLGATYNLQLGKFYLRPSADVDSVFLNEGGYTETGGGAAVNLKVDSRSNYEAAAQAGIVVGGMFGSSYHWGPEFSIAYRSILASGDGSTTGAFASVPGSTFDISGLSREKGLLVIRAALRGQGAYSNFALEAGSEIGKDFSAYMARFVVRFLF